MSLPAEGERGRDPFRYDGGDLCLPSPVGSELRLQALLVEVKSPTDSLSDKQVVWLNLLNRHGVPSVVCRVQEKPKGPVRPKKKKKEEEEEEEERVAREPISSRKGRGKGNGEGTSKLPVNLVYIDSDSD